jgi:hypothetical protein
MASPSCVKRDLAAGGAGRWFWGLPLVLIAAALVWPSAWSPLWAVAFLWSGGACLVNARRCGRVHCHVTGPLYLGLGVACALIGLGFLTWSWHIVGTAFAIGTAIAFVPEFAGRRYLRDGS